MLSRLSARDWHLRLPWILATALDPAHALVIRYDRDFDYDFFGFKTLERSYLLKMHGQVREGGARAPITLSHV